MNEPKIVEISERKLIGVRIQTSLCENRTFELWKGFKQKIKEVECKREAGFYSLQNYEGSLEMENFTPTTIFEKWAAVEVDHFDVVPNGLEKYTLREGIYAVFIHQGNESTFSKTVQYIYGEWIPKSEFELDNRTHFQLMGEKYKLNDPNSEEEVWVPIKKKN